MKYKEGGRVRIRKDLKVGTEYGSEVFVSMMKEYCGRQAEIGMVGKGYYRLNMGGKHWYWTDEMFEPVGKFKEIGSTVIHVKTRKEYDELMEILEEYGIGWITGKEATKFLGVYDIYENETCIRVKDRHLLYTDKAWYLEEGYKVISLDKFKEIQGLGKFKPGDKVMCIEGSYKRNIDVVKSVPGMKEYNSRGFHCADEGFCLKKAGWDYQKNWEIVDELHCDMSGSSSSSWKTLTLESMMEALEGIRGIDEIREIPKKKGGKMKALARKLLDSDIRALIEDGILNDDLSVGDTSAVLEFLVFNFKKELAVEARKRIKDRKKK